MNVKISLKSMWTDLKWEKDEEKYNIGYGLSIKFLHIGYGLNISFLHIGYGLNINFLLFLARGWAFFTFLHRAEKFTGIRSGELILSLQ